MIPCDQDHVGVVRHPRLLYTEHTAPLHPTAPHYTTATHYPTAPHCTPLHRDSHNPSSSALEGLPDSPCDARAPRELGELQRRLARARARVEHSIRRAERRAGGDEEARHLRIVGEIAHEVEGGVAIVDDRGGVRAPRQQVPGRLVPAVDDRVEQRRVAGDARLVNVLGEGGIGERGVEEGEVALAGRLEPRTQLQRSDAEQRKREEDGAQDGAAHGPSTKYKAYKIVYTAKGE